MSLPYPSMVFVPLDILTAEEMNQLVANIESLAATETYTTTEQVVGTWTDGKTVYRKIITVPGVSGTANYDSSFGLRIDSLVSAQGWLVNSPATNYKEYMTPFYPTGTMFYRYFIRTLTTGDTMVCSRLGSELLSSLGTFSFLYIVEYTKSTD